MTGMPANAPETVVGESGEPGAASPVPANGPSAKCGRKLKTVRSYYDLVDAFRARVLELGTDFEEVDRVAGYTETYTSKLLAPRPSRNFGEVSLGSMLGALGLELHVVENPAATAKAKQRLKRRAYAPVVPRPENRPVVFRLSRRHFSRIGKLGAAAYRAKVPPERRSAIARNASRKRWHRPVIKEIEPAK
jgi:hypothetical protein